MEPQDIASIIMTISSIIGSIAFVISKINSYHNDVIILKKEIARIQETVKEHDNVLREQSSTIISDIQKKNVTLETQLEAIKETIKHIQEEQRYLRQNCTK